MLPQKFENNGVWNIAAQAKIAAEKEIAALSLSHGEEQSSAHGSDGEERSFAPGSSSAAAAHRDVRILHLRSAGPDHPFALECPETRYLKVAVMQVR